MKILRALLLCLLLVFPLLSLFMVPISSLGQRSFSSATPAPPFTLTASNVTANPGETATATITVHSTGNPVTISLKIGNYDTEFLSCDSTPTPSAGLTAPPNATSTFDCSSDDSGNFSVQVIGTDTAGQTALVLVYFTFLQPQGTTSPQGNQTTSPGTVIPLIYVAVGAAIIVIAVMAGITAYAFRKWRI